MFAIEDCIKRVGKLTTTMILHTRDYKVTLNADTECLTKFLAELKSSFQIAEFKHRTKQTIKKPYPIVSTTPP